MSVQEPDLARLLSDLSLVLQRPIVEKILGKERAEDDRKKCSRWQELLQSGNQIRILVKGNKRAGKSTLLNALLGADILPTTDHPECTALPIAIRKAKEFRLVAIGNVKKRDLVGLPDDVLLTEEPDQLIFRRIGTRVDPPWISTLITQLGTTRASSQVLKELQELRIEFPEATLDDHFVLIDTPGTYGNDAKREQASNQQFAFAPACILVINWKQTPGSDFYKSISESLNPLTDREIIIAITHSDLAKKSNEKSSMRIAIDEIARKLKENGFKDVSFVEISAKNARIHQKLINGQATIREIIDDDYAPLSKLEMRSLGEDKIKWTEVLGRSGNIQALQSWLNAQRNLAGKTKWITSQARNIAWSTHTGISLHINLENQKLGMKIQRLDERYQVDSDRLSNQLEALPMKKDKILLNFQTAISSLCRKIGTEPSSHDTSEYYTDASIRSLFCDIERLFDNQPATAESRANQLISAYVAREDSRIGEKFSLATGVLYQELGKLTQNAWSLSFPQLSFSVVQPTEDRLPIRDVLFSAAHGISIAVYGATNGNLFFVGSGILKLSLTIIAYLKDAKQHSKKYLVAQTILESSGSMKERVDSIKKELVRRQMVISKETDAYFSDQISRISELQSTLKANLDNEKRTPQELSELKLLQSELDWIMTSLDSASV